MPHLFCVAVSYHLFYMCEENLALSIIWMWRDSQEGPKITDNIKMDNKGIRKREFSTALFFTSFHYLGYNTAKLVFINLVRSHPESRNQKYINLIITNSRHWIFSCSFFLNILIKSTIKPLSLRGHIRNGKSYNLN